MKVGARLAVFVWLTVCSATRSPLHAQTPASQNPIDPSSPLAPVQERDEQTRQYDPLDHTDAKRNQQRRAPNATAANSSGEPSDPDAAGDESPASPMQDFQGPVVLTRSFGFDQLELPTNLKWKESVNVGTSYSSGISPGGVSGAANGGSLQGINVSWSLSGSHAFGHDQLGFSYSSGLTYYPQSSFYTGGNHSVSLRYSHIVSRRLSTSLNATGSLLSANAALQAPASGVSTIANVNLAINPNTSILSGGSKQGTLGAGLNWQFTSRLSIGLNVSAFGTRQDSSLLTGVSGESAGGNLNYRFSKRTTIGATYSYSQYVYPHRTQTSDSHSVGLIYSYAIDNRTQFGLNAGIGRTETLSLQIVPLNPVIAAILGIGTGVIDAYQTFRSMNTSAQLTRSLRRGRQLSVAYARGVSPGNGLIRTSQQQTVTVNLSGTLFTFRGYAVSGGGGWDDLSAIGQAVGSYGGEFATVSVGRSYRGGMALSFGMQYRHFDVAAVSALHNQVTFNTSFSWSRTSRGLWLY